MEKKVAAAEQDTKEEVEATLEAIDARAYAESLPSEKMATVTSE